MYGFAGREDLNSAGVLLGRESRRYPPPQDAPRDAQAEIEALDRGPPVATLRPDKRQSPSASLLEGS